MAPEQFQGKAVFASDVYSIGVTMYQMLTGMMPYNTPTPADLERLQRNELVTPPRLRNPKIPKAINDIVMKALQADLAARYQRAGDLLQDVLAAGMPAPRRPGRTTPAGVSSDESASIKSRLKARDEMLPARFCWHCRKPLHARADRCPFCQEKQ
jgi:serine/threonine protein kinase